MADVGQDLGGQVVLRFVVAVTQVRGHHGLGHVGRSGAGGVQEGAAGAPDFVHDLFGELEHAGAVALGVVTVEVDQPGPTAPDAQDAVSLAQRTHRDGANRRVQPRHVAATRQNRNRTLRALHAGHGWQAATLARPLRPASNRFRADSAQTGLSAAVRSIGGSSRYLYATAALLGPASGTNSVREKPASLHHALNWPWV